MQKMKRIYISILFLSLSSILLFSQTGTIKIVKPISPKKDTVVTSPKRTIYITTSAASNYTFKGNNNMGYEAEVTIPFHNILFIGLKYSNENEYYQLSPFNKETFKQETPYQKSATKSEYLKLPIVVKEYYNIGKRGYFLFSFGLTPEYLIKTKNQFNRLNYSDFNKFNLAGTISIGHSILRKYCSINLCYSKDFFENLKDKKIYDPNGAIVGKQKSKTNLLSLSLSYYIQYERK